jgi:hypothetical protein
VRAVILSIIDVEDTLQRLRPTRRAETSTVALEDRATR